MPRPKEYVIYCDESISKGAHFSNFYGGALVSSDRIDAVRASIAAKKAELNLHGEVKWSKITANYRQKYIDLIDHFFDQIEGGSIKIRIMFTQSMFEARGLTAEQVEDTYFILYYHFIKHAFGLMHYPPAGTGDGPIDLRVYLDLIPDTDEKKQRFKSYICSLGRNPEFRTAGLRVSPENVTDVVSHDHDLLQCLDIVLGSMQFRLNDKHKEKVPGTNRRGKRTLAKEAVYKHINARIRRIRPGFNVGISTGIDGDRANRWHHLYRHWLFLPEQRALVGSSKRKGVATPS